MTAKELIKALEEVAGRRWAGMEEGALPHRRCLGGMVVVAYVYCGDLMVKKK